MLHTDIVCVNQGDGCGCNSNECHCEPGKCSCTAEKTCGCWKVFCLIEFSHQAGSWYLFGLERDSVGWFGVLYTVA